MEKQASINSGDNERRQKEFNSLSDSQKVMYMGVLEKNPNLPHEEIIRQIKDSTVGHGTIAGAAIGGAIAGAALERPFIGGALSAGLAGGIAGGIGATCFQQAPTWDDVVKRISKNK